MSMQLEVPVQFRLCRREDLAALEWMGLHTREREIIANTFAAQERGEALMLLAVANDFPIGQVWLDFARQGHPDCPRLWAVRVFPPLQRAGLGGELMREAEALAAGRGARAVEVGVEWHNEDAGRFYARLGYAPVGAEREETHYSFEGYPLVMSIDQQILRKRLDRVAAPRRTVSRGSCRQLPFNAALCRSYDLRGVVGRDLTAADAHGVGRAFAAMARETDRRAIAVSRDGRLSSPWLLDALVDGLSAGGMQVHCLPVGPTPLLSFAVQRLSLDGAVMVTGSHNPVDQNGFKFLLGGEPLHGDALQALLQTDAAASRGGSVRDADVSDAYLALLSSELRHTRPLSIAWDCGNGATGPLVERLVQRVPGRHVLIHTTMDGRFPNHHPDPSVPENLQDLSEAVVRHGCDLGVAFDGDGDRIGVVDSLGRILWPDQLLLLLARDLLQEDPGRTIVADVKSSGILFEGIARAGGRPRMGPSGYVLVREQMIRESAPLAGELSGHIFFADRWHGSDDGVYVAIRLLRALARSSEALAEFRDSLPLTAATPEIRLPCPDDRKAEVIAEVGNRMERARKAVDRTDGIRVSDDNGWWLLRASGTEPKVTVRCEAPDQPALEALKAELSAQLRAVGVDPSSLETAAAG